MRHRPPQPPHPRNCLCSPPPARASVPRSVRRDPKCRSAIIAQKPPLTDAEEAALDATLHRIAETHGVLSNLMQTLVLAPRALAAFAEVSNYTRHACRLSELQRQLALLIGVRNVHSAWVRQMPLGQAAGLSEGQVALIREGRTPRDLPSAERALCEYASEIAEDIRGAFTPGQIVDIALVTAFALATAALTVGLQVEPDGPETLRIELEALAARMG